MSNLKVNKKYLIIFITVFAISLSFAIYTKHTWEEWYNAYRCSKNLAMGNGPVYTVGQKVHVFTSPLGMIIPALLNVITCNSSDNLVLWLFRIVGCLLLGLSAVLLFKLAKRNLLHTLATIFLIGMLAININILDFSVNGMEISFMIFFLTCAIYAMAAPLRYPFLSLGLAWAGLMWTRPDSFVYIAGLSLGYLLFNPALPNITSRRQLLKLYTKAGAVLAALYLPWILWAWHYYGTPVPHPIIAKGLTPLVNLTPESLIIRLTKQVFTSPLIFGLRTLRCTFMPPYFQFGGWNNLVYDYSQPLAFVSAFYWVLPFARPQARSISFGLMVAHIYLSFMPGWYPWYIPPATFLSILVLSQIIHQALNLKTILRDTLNSKKLYGLKVTIYSLACIIFLTSLCLTLAASYQLRLQQEIIENGNRKQVGLWLKDNASTPKDSVFVEPVGYIGFFSQLKMYDFPGLSSPEVVAARKRVNPESYAEIIFDWLVLRPSEIVNIQREIPTLLSESYRVVKIFDVSKRLESYRFIPGRNWLIFDQTFFIFKNRQL